MIWAINTQASSEVQYHGGSGAGTFDIKLDVTDTPGNKSVNPELVGPTTNYTV